MAVRPIDPGSIPDAIILRYKFYCFVVKVSAFTSSGPGFNSQQGCLRLEGSWAKALLATGTGTYLLRAEGWRTGCTCMLYILHTVRTACRLTPACRRHVLHTVRTAYSYIASLPLAADRRHVLKTTRHSWNIWFRISTSDKSRRAKDSNLVWKL